MAENWGIKLLFRKDDKSYHLQYVRTYGSIIVEREMVKMRHKEILELLKNATRGELLDALEEAKDEELRHLIIQELLSR